MHGLDLAMGCNRRAREPFDATVVRIGLGPRHQLGEGRGGNALRLSKKELRKRGHQNMLHAWQTNSSEKGKRERPDLGDKDRLPDFLMVTDLDRDVAPAKRQVEFQKESTFSRFGEIGVSRGNQRS